MSSAAAGSALTEKEHRVIHVVEDDILVRDLLQATLEIEGFRVITSGNGDKAIAKAIEEKPDLMILDIKIPGRNGLEVMESLRLNPETQSLPILFLSSVTDDAVVVKCILEGGDYVTKPWKDGEIIARIRRLLEQAERRKARAQWFEEKLPLRSGGEVVMLALEDIVYVGAEDKYSRVHTKGKTILVDSPIGEMERKLKGHQDFLKIHRSTIINLRHVRSTRRFSPKLIVVKMDDAACTELHASRTYHAALREKLNA